MSTDWISKWSLYTPAKTALFELETGLSISYAELNREAEILASVLLNKYKLKKGERLAMISEFSIACFTLFVAAQKTGIILVPLNYRLSVPELEYILQDSDPKLILAEEKYVSLVKNDYLKCEVLQVVLEEALKVIPESYPTQQISEDDALFILYTSGTTGFPKGALYTHKMMFWNSMNTILRLQLNGSDSTLLCTPSFHTGGWNVLATPLLHVGGTIYIMRKFEPSQTIQILMEKQISVFMTVPTMTKMLAEHLDFVSAQFPFMKNYIVGGEALPIPVIETWGNKSVFIRQGYGLTEAGPNITSLPEQDAIRKRGSIGFVNFYVDYKLVNESGVESQTNEPGELWLRGDVVTPGYWRNPKASVDAFSGDWFKTGDVMICDEDGYLYLVDRKKNMFISGGENVYPAEVEKVLRQYESISEVAVIGIPDEKWGEVGLAYYSSFNGVNIEEEKLREFCLSQLAKYKIPKQFVHLNELPKNDTGKLDKKFLKQLFESSNFLNNKE